MNRIIGVRLVLVGIALILAAWPARAQDKVTPDEALKRLKEGHARFLAGTPKEKYIEENKWNELKEKQRPIATVLACSDSRADPVIIFDKNLGELFKIRVAGNVTDPIILGSIEYSVAVLQTPLIVLLGHTRCGAVEAALAGKELPSDNLKQLIAKVYVGQDLPKDKQAALNAAIRANVLHHTAQLTKQSKIISELAASGRIKIVAGVYSLQTGEVEWLELPKK